MRRAIAEHQIDLIVMGTKGASGLKEATIGSRTGEVITRVKCPVLVVPEHAEYKGVKQIVFPTDFNCFYKSRILSTLSGIMALDQAKVNILHIGPEAVLSDQQHENKVVLEDFFENGPHEFHFLFERNIEAGLNAFSEDHQVDLIAMVARNVNFFQRLLFKPTVAKISFHTRIPFLVLHE
ncbi:MAG: universal stress protein [Bacteroidota bacterium]